MVCILKQSYHNIDKNFVLMCEFMPSTMYLLGKLNRGILMKEQEDLVHHMENFAWDFLDEFHLILE